MTTVTISLADWLTWVPTYEPTLNNITPTPGIMTDSYTEAESTMQGLSNYLSRQIYRLLIYRYALHVSIVNSGNSNVTQLKRLYDQYEIKKYAGIIQSASDGPSSATKLIPNGLQMGDAQTMMLWATPYGQAVEQIFQQLKNIAITI